MELAININPADINKAVTQAILDSVIGKQIHEAIQRELETLSATWGNPIDKIIQDIVMAEARNVVINEYQKTIKEKVKERLTDEVIANIVTLAIDKLYK